MVRATDEGDPNARANILKRRSVRSFHSSNGSHGKTD